MNKILKIIVICLLIQQSISLPFLRSLTSTIVTTTEETNISDFRDQPRADSRADKPDVFPDFDFDDEGEEMVTLRPKSRREVYIEIISALLKNFRSRIQSAYEKLVKASYRDVGKTTAPKSVVYFDEKDEKDEKDASKDEELMRKVRDVDEVVVGITTEFVGLSLGDEHDSGMDVNDPSAIDDIAFPEPSNPNFLLTVIRNIGYLFHNNNDEPTSNKTRTDMKIDFPAKIKSIISIKQNLLKNLIESWRHSKAINATEIESDPETETDTVEPGVDDLDLDDQVQLDQPNERITLQLPTFERSIDRSDGGTGKNFDSAGIAILEFFGTIIGLSWGALSQAFMRN